MPNNSTSDQVASADAELANIDVTTLPQEEALKIIGRVLAAKKVATPAATSKASMDELLRQHRNGVLTKEQKNRGPRHGPA